MAAVGGRLLLVSDFFMSFMWVWSSVLIKIFVYKILGYGTHDLKGEILRYGISIVNMFFFAYLAKATKGGAYNPLTILSSAISGDFSNFLFTVGARIPIQVLGSIYGVRFILAAFPEIGRGPRLNVDIARGALTEGLLTFGIVIISQGLSRKIPGSFFMKTWISSVSKLTLHILGSDLTGGCMNPASVMGWAFAHGEHTSKKHLIVYWLAPMEATLAAVWAFRLIVRPKKDETLKAKSVKSD
ncbi:probable aquaporin SIP2-1 [Olea europaea subsp. europaea]|uniref:Probable aquaporin SIP2-1 n=1 Tax=Olea europaea subsp. europaea TaxID=158383 RepID=A0A8S0R792_OLEEU|nr:probable aquaporin SIP2-1 [Olea europaea subsp. europaea]